MTSCSSPQKVYKFLLLTSFFAIVTYSSCHAWSDENNNVTQCVESERQALLKFKHGITKDHCGLLDSWVEDRDCCKWRGVKCESHSGHVTSLRLHGHGNSFSVPGIPEVSYYVYSPCLEGIINITLIELKHLKYLDLSCNNFTSHFPKFIGSLANLVHLNLSRSGLNGVIPQEIGNLSRLLSLDLNDEDLLDLRAESLHWLSRLTLLRYLDLSYINMTMVSNTSWLPIVNSLPFLEVLRLNLCELSLELPYSLSYDNSSSTLKVVSLFRNNFNDTSVFKWLFNLTRVETILVYVDLSFNDLFGNNIQADEYALRFLGNLCSLQHLALHSTELNYNFSEIIQLLVACPNNKLKYLDLGANKAWGSIPENIDTLSSLTELSVVSNQLNGTIPPSLWRLSMLESLDLSLNSLSGVVTSAHLSNLSHLSWLYLGNNKDMVINISANWIPPFQLHRLDLSSSKVGPEFPMWLSTQKNLTYISLYNTSISSTVHVSFFESLSSNLEYLDMSKNMMYGVIPDVSPITFESSPVINLSSNNFTGAIPRFLRNVSVLLLSNNKFSQGLVPLLCPQTKMPLYFLNLSNNSFSDKLPDCWGYLNQLEILNLKNNKLQGNLPASLGELDELGILQLSNNNISGELPTSLANCTSLFVLDLADNSLTGYIPSTFGHSLKNLNILTLQHNYFVGTIPSSLCYLSRLQIISISNNQFHGTIPKCIYNLKGMATKEGLLELIGFTFGTSTDVDALLLMWKGTKQIFDSDHSLGLVKYIDFSNNMLEGHIPEGISSLIGLKTINLSSNHLSGAIPLEIGRLTSLETLDLSHNHLSGEIPTSLAQVSSLNGLDLSYNNLSGKIPTGTQLQGFDASYYTGNPRLCGAPLPTCQKDGAPATSMSQNGYGISREKVHDIDDFMIGLYISVVLGFIVGFWGVCGSLVLKTSWRHAFFRIFDDLKDRIYVTVVVSIARVWRRS